MIVWVASYSRSGNTFFRIALTHLFKVDTTAAFDAGESLLAIGDGGALVSHKSLPAPLTAAIHSGEATRIRAALEEMEESETLYIIKTHAPPYKLFGVGARAVLLVRDGRDSLASFANYAIDVPFDRLGIRRRWRSAAKWPLLSPKMWIYLAKAGSVALLKRMGLRKYLVSKKVDKLLAARDSTYLSWGLMNRAWLNHRPQPHIVSFDELTRDPVTTVRNAVRALGLELEDANREIPTFESLKSAYPNFFRAGRSGDWENWLSSKQEATLWKCYGDVMTDLGYVRGPRRARRPHRRTH